LIVNIWNSFHAFLDCKPELTGVKRDRNEFL
jgi:hypothetical protein